MLRALSIQPKEIENFETGTNGTEIALKNFQKIRKLLNLQKANHANILQWKFPSIGIGIFYRMESAPYAN